jgi:uncharacterized protein (DUF2235 family)
MGIYGPGACRGSSHVPIALSRQRRPHPLRNSAFREPDSKRAGMTHTFQVATGFKATFCRQCPLDFVGVWDTVSSVGWIWDPAKLPCTPQNPDMMSGRHAVSIDERGCYFRNNWGAPSPGQSHSDIGGSYVEAESGLSKITLEWMLSEALQAGLVVDRQKAEQILGRIPPASPSPPDPKAATHNSLTWYWWILESFPHSCYDPVLKKAKSRIQFGARRFIPEGSVQQ